MDTGECHLQSSSTLDLWHDQTWVFFFWVKTGGYVDIRTPKIGTDVWQTQYNRRAFLKGTEQRRQAVIHIDYTAPYHCSISSPMAGQRYTISPAEQHLTPTRCTHNFLDVTQGDVYLPITDDTVFSVSAKGWQSQDAPIQRLVLQVFKTIKASGLKIDASAAITESIVYYYKDRAHSHQRRHPSARCNTNDAAQHCDPNVVGQSFDQPPLDSAVVFNIDDSKMATALPANSIFVLSFLLTAVDLAGNSISTRKNVFYAGPASPGVVLAPSFTKLVVPTATMDPARLEPGSPDWYWQSVTDSLRVEWTDAFANHAFSDNIYLPFDSTDQTAPSEPYDPDRSFSRHGLQGLFNSRHKNGIVLYQWRITKTGASTAPGTPSVEADPLPSWTMVPQPLPDTLVDYVEWTGTGVHLIMATPSTHFRLAQDTTKCLQQAGKTICSHALELVKPLDFEQQTSYPLSVAIWDASVGASSPAGTVAFTVTIADVNESPYDIRADNVRVPENSPGPRFIGTVWAHDVESGSGANHVCLSPQCTCVVAEDPSGQFEMRAGNKLYLKAGRTLDFEQRWSWAVVVQCADGNTASPSPPRRQALTIEVLDVNEPPATITLTKNTIPENSPGGFVVGKFNVQDPEEMQTHTFVMVDNAGGRFQVDATTGLLTVAAGAVLDYEAASSHTILIRATDNGLIYNKGRTDPSRFLQASFIVHLADVNEAPSNLRLSGGLIVTVREDAVAAGGEVGPITIADPDHSTAPWAAAAYMFINTGIGNGNYFELDRSTGSRLVWAEQVALAPPSPGSYTVQIVLSDHPFTLTQSFLVVVERVNSPCVVSTTSLKVSEAAAPGSFVGFVSAADREDGVISGSRGLQLADDRGLFELRSIPPAAGSDLWTYAVLLRSDLPGGRLDHEVRTVIHPSIVCTDSNGLASSPQRISINVTNADEPPFALQLISLDASAPAVGDADPIGSVVGWLQAVDPDPRPAPSGTPGSTTTTTTTTTSSSSPWKSWTLLDTAGGRFGVRVPDPALGEDEYPAGSALLVVSRMLAGETADTFTITAAVSDDADPPNTAQADFVVRLVRRPRATSAAPLRFTADQLARRFRLEIQGHDLSDAVQLLVTAPDEASCTSASAGNASSRIAGHTAVAVQDGAPAFLIHPSNKHGAVSTMMLADLEFFELGHGHLCTRVPDPASLMTFTAWEPLAEYELSNTSSPGAVSYTLQLRLMDGSPSPPPARRRSADQMEPAANSFQNTHSAAMALALTTSVFGAQVSQVPTTSNTSLTVTYHRLVLPERPVSSTDREWMEFAAVSLEKLVVLPQCALQLVHSLGTEHAVQLNITQPTATLFFVGIGDDVAFPVLVGLDVVCEVSGPANTQQQTFATHIVEVALAGKSGSRADSESRLRRAVLQLEPDHIPANSQAGTVVGVLSLGDLNQDSGHQFELMPSVDGSASPNITCPSTAFAIASGRKLIVADPACLDHKRHPFLELRVAIAGRPDSPIWLVTVQVDNVDEGPSALAVSDASDTNADNVHTFSLSFSGAHDQLSNIVSVALRHSQGGLFEVLRIGDGEEDASNSSSSSSPPTPWQLSVDFARGPCLVPQQPYTAWLEVVAHKAAPAVFPVTFAFEERGDGDNDSAVNLVVDSEGEALHILAPLSNDQAHLDPDALQLPAQRTLRSSPPLHHISLPSRWMCTGATLDSDPAANATSSRARRAVTLSSSNPRFSVSFSASLTLSEDHAWPSTVGELQVSEAGTSSLGLHSGHEYKIEVRAHDLAAVGTDHSRWGESNWPDHFPHRLGAQHTKTLAYKLRIDNSAPLILDLFLERRSEGHREPLPILTMADDAAVLSQLLTDDDGSLAEDGLTFWPYSDLRTLVVNYGLDDPESGLRSVTWKLLEAHHRFAPEVAAGRPQPILAQGQWGVRNTYQPTAQSSRVCRNAPPRSGVDSTADHLCTSHNPADCGFRLPATACFCTTYSGANFCYDQYYSQHVGSTAGVTLAGGTSQHHHMVEFDVQLEVENYAQLRRSETLRVRVDTTPPQPGLVKDAPEFSAADIDVQESQAAQVAAWGGFSDPESGIAFYEVHFDTQCITADMYCGGADCVEDALSGTCRESCVASNRINTALRASFRSGRTTQLSARSATPPVGQGPFYATVVAYNHALTRSIFVCSDGVMVDSSKPVLLDLVPLHVHIRPGLITAGGDVWLVTADGLKHPVAERCVTKAQPVADPEAFLSAGSSERFERLGVDRELEGGAFSRGYADKRDMSAHFDTSTACAVFPPLRMFQYADEESISLSWIGRDAESGIVDFEVAVGSTASVGNADMLPFTSTHRHNTFTALRTVNIGVYGEMFLKVKAIDVARNERIATLGPIELDTTPPTPASGRSAGDLVLTHDGSSVHLAWPSDLFADPQSGICQLSFAITADMDAAPPGSSSLWHELEDARDCRVTATKASLSLATVPALQEGHALRGHLRAWNGARLATTLTSSPLWIIREAPAQGHVREVSLAASQPIDARDIDFQQSRSSIRVAWTPFLYPHGQLYVTYAVSLRSGRAGKTVVVDWQTLPAASTQTPDGLTFTFSGLALDVGRRYQAAVRASTQGGSTVVFSDGIRVVDTSGSNAGAGAGAGAAVLLGPGCSTNDDLPYTHTMPDNALNLGRVCEGFEPPCNSTTGEVGWTAIAGTARRVDLYDGSKMRGATALEMGDGAVVELRGDSRVGYLYTPMLECALESVASTQSSALLDVTVLAPMSSGSSTGKKEWHTVSHQAVTVTLPSSSASWHAVTLPAFVAAHAHFKVALRAHLPGSQDAGARLLVDNVRVSMCSEDVHDVSDPAEPLVVRWHGLPGPLQYVQRYEMGLFAPDLAHEHRQPGAVIPAASVLRPFSSVGLHTQTVVVPAQVSEFSAFLVAVRACHADDGGCYPPVFASQPLHVRRPLLPGLIEAKVIIETDGLRLAASWEHFLEDDSLTPARLYSWALALSNSGAELLTGWRTISKDIADVGVGVEDETSGLFSWNSTHVTVKAFLPGVGVPSGAARGGGSAANLYLLVEGFGRAPGAPVVGSVLAAMTSTAEKVVIELDEVPDFDSLNVRSTFTNLDYTRRSDVFAAVWPSARIARAHPRISGLTFAWSLSTAAEYSPLCAGTAQAGEQPVDTARRVAAALAAETTETVGSPLSPLLHSAAGDRLRSAGEELVACGVTSDNGFFLEDLELQSGRRYHPCVKIVDVASPPLATWEAEQRRALLAWTSCGDGVTVDQTPPQPAAVRIGALHALESATTLMHGSQALAVAWGQFVDVEEQGAGAHHSGIRMYELAIGSTPGGADVLPRHSVGARHHMVVSNLTLADGLRYYATVWATDYVGLRTQSTSAEGALVDGSPPVRGMVLVSNSPLPLYHSHAAELEVSWVGFSDPHSHIAFYEWAVGSSAGAADILPFARVPGTVSSVTTTNPVALQQGHSIFVTVRAFNGVSLHVEAVSGEVVVDSTPPVPGAVHDGPAGGGDGGRNEDVDVVSSNSALSAHWTPFADPHSGIMYYEVALGTADEPELLIGFRNVRLALATVFELPAPIPDGMRVVAWVRGCNRALLCAEQSSDGVVVDTSPPVAGRVWDGLGGTEHEFQPYRRMLAANWAGFYDPHSALHMFEWCVGTSVGSCDTLGWTSAHLDSMAYAFAPADLPQNTRLFATVRATNAAGLSASATSSGFVVDRTPPVHGSRATAFDLARLEPNRVSLPHLAAGFQPFRSVLRATWDYRDDESGVLESRWSVGLHHDFRGPAPVEPQSVGGADEGVQGRLELDSGDEYFLKVTVCNGARLCTTDDAGSVVVDTTPPTAGRFIEAMSWDAVANTATIKWTGFQDLHSGMAAYEVTLFHATTTVTVGKEDAWDHIYGATVHLAAATPLELDKQYTLVLVAYNKAGLAVAVEAVVEARGAAAVGGALEILHEACHLRRLCQKQYRDPTGTACTPGLGVGLAEAPRACVCSVPVTHCSFDQAVDSATTGQPYVDVRSSLVVTVRDGFAAGLDASHQAFGHALGGTWEVTSDAAHRKHILRYEYSVGKKLDGTAAVFPGQGFWNGGQDEVWFPAGLSTQGVVTVPGMDASQGLAPLDGTYVFFVRAWLQTDAAATTRFMIFRSNGVTVRTRGPRFRTNPRVLDGHAERNVDYWEGDEQRPAGKGSVHAYVDLEYQASARSIGALWGWRDLDGWDGMVAEDDLDSLHRYEWAVGDHPGGSNVRAFAPPDGGLLAAGGVAEKKDGGAPSGATAGDLASVLRSGQRYFSTVRAVDQTGLSVLLGSNGVTVDTTAPLAGVVELGLAFAYGSVGSEVRAATSATGEMTVHWMGFADHESGILGYEVGLSLSPDTVLRTVRVGGGEGAAGRTSSVVEPKDMLPWPAGARIVDVGAGVAVGARAGGGRGMEVTADVQCTDSGRLFASVGLRLQAKFTGLALAHGQQVYVWVRAVNGAGLRSDMVRSRGVLVDVTPPTCRSCLRGQAELLADPMLEESESGGGGGGDWVLSGGAAAVELAEHGGGRVVKLVAGGAAMSQTVGGLQGGAWYELRLHVTSSVAAGGVPSGGLLEVALGDMRRTLPVTEGRVVHGEGRGRGQLLWRQMTVHVKVDGMATTSTTVRVANFGSQVPVWVELVSLRRCVGSGLQVVEKGEDAERQQTVVVDEDGRSFATLEMGRASDPGRACQVGVLELPAGWRIAPDNQYSRRVVAAHMWGTSCLVLGSGRSWHTARREPDDPEPGSNCEDSGSLCSAAGACGDHIDVQAAGEALGSGGPVTLSLGARSCDVARRILLEKVAPVHVGGRFQHALAHVACSWLVEDEDSGVKQVEWALGSVRRGVQLLELTSVGTQTWGEVHTLDLAHNMRVQAMVRVTNHAGEVAIFDSHVVRIDTTPPVVGKVLDRRGVVFGQPRLGALWTAAHDPESGLAWCEWALGEIDEAGAFVSRDDNVYGWRRVWANWDGSGEGDAALEAEVTFDEGVLKDQTRYAASVRCANGAGLVAEARSVGALYVAKAVDASAASVWVQTNRFVRPSGLAAPLNASIQPVLTSLHVEWDGFDDRHHLAGYEVRVEEEGAVGGEESGGGSGGGSGQGCASGTYFAGRDRAGQGMCSDCHAACTRCSGPSKTQCSECALGYKSDGRRCIARACPENSAEDPDTSKCWYKAGHGVHSLVLDYTNFPLQQGMAYVVAVRAVVEEEGEGESAGVRLRMVSPAVKARVMTDATPPAVRRQRGPHGNGVFLAFVGKELLVDWTGIFAEDVAWNTLRFEVAIGLASQRGHWAVQDWTAVVDPEGRGEGGGSVGGGAGGGGVGADGADGGDGAGAAGVAMTAITPTSLRKAGLEPFFRDDIVFVIGVRATNTAGLHATITQSIPSLTQAELGALQSAGGGHG